jgi:hypothetical protein
MIPFIKSALENNLKVPVIGAHHSYQDRGFVCCELELECINDVLRGGKNQSNKTSAIVS